MIKKIYFVWAVLMITSCSVTTYSKYSGEIYPANVTFNSPNFKYIKTVKGASNASFSASGWDQKRADGIVNEAKKNLYKQIVLKENQVPTNFTLDFVKVEKPSTGGYTLLRQVRAVLTADIFEFSNNGVYSLSSENQQTIIQNNQNEEKTSKIENHNKNLTENENSNNSLSNKLKIGYKPIDKYTKLRGGYEVLYFDGKNHFVGKIKFKNSLGEYTIEDIKKYNETNKKWEEIKVEKNSIELGLIIGYKI